MPTFALIMLAESLLGFAIATALSLVACKNSVSTNSVKAKLITLICIVFINVIYTGIAALNIYINSFAVDVSMTMKTPCYVLGLTSFICSIIQGSIIKKSIVNGSLGVESIKKLTGKIFIPEIISIAGILYFLLQSKIPL